MARSVIQIAADPSYLYALCDDGEIFRLVSHAWQPMAPIPQEQPRSAGRNPDLIPTKINSQAGETSDLRENEMFSGASEWSHHRSSEVGTLEWASNG
jgi:hypothetical protein